MARELIVATNPARRRRKQSAKQRAASLRNLKKARSARKTTRRKNPSRRSAAPKRRYGTSPRAATRRRTGTRRRGPARRRNPIALPTRGRLIPRDFVGRTLIPAAVGGGAAVANDVAYNFALGLVPATLAPDLTEQFRSGYLRHVGKIGSALLLSLAAGMVLPRRTADQMGAGMITVVGYNVVRDVVAQVAPDVNMGMYLEPSLGAYPGAGMNPGGHLLRRRPNLGRFISPAPTGQGGVRVPRQLSQGHPYRMPTMGPMYADESDGYTEGAY